LQHILVQENNWTSAYTFAQLLQICTEYLPKTYIQAQLANNISVLKVISCWAHLAVITNNHTDIDIPERRKAENLIFLRTCCAVKPNGWCRLVCHPPPTQSSTLDDWRNDARPPFEQKFVTKQYVIWL